VPLIKDHNISPNIETLFGLSSHMNNPEVCLKHCLIQGSCNEQAPPKNYRIMAR